MPLALLSEAFTLLLCVTLAGIPPLQKNKDTQEHSAGVGNQKRDSGRTRSAEAVTTILFNACIPPAPQDDNPVEETEFLFFFKKRKTNHEPPACCVSQIAPCSFSVIQYVA